MSVIVLNQNTKREQGNKVQTGIISAVKNVAEVVKTCLGPKAMLKMLMDPMGGIVMTNDGNAIVRELAPQHPAAKTMIETARTQDEEVGDGTTAVIILGGEMMGAAEQFISHKIHPTVVIAAYQKVMDDSIAILKEISTPMDVGDLAKMTEIVRSAVGTKFIGKWGDLACEIALKAVSCVSVEANGRKEIDIKRYAKVEKVPGGTIAESRVLQGVMINKDVVNARMKRRIVNPRILLLDCSLEYKKGESQTDIEMTQETDFEKILQLEEEYIKQVCEDVIRLKPDIIVSEKGISDLAQHFLVKANITAIRRLRKTDNLRIERAVGATIVGRTDELKEEHLGTGCGLFEVRKIGDESFAFFEECKEPKACTILLRGASKDVLHEVERNLQDAMCVARNALIEPRLLPGGGATEMALACRLSEKAKSIEGIIQGPYKAAALAFEVIPRILLKNCGSNIIRSLTALRAKHAGGSNGQIGVDGSNGQLRDMSELGIWDLYAVKSQTIKTAMEISIGLLRIDDIVSAKTKE